jgi:hypothetical protein
VEFGWRSAVFERSIADSADLGCLLPAVPHVPKGAETDSSMQVWVHAATV